MPKHPVEKIFKECGAILEGHFVLSAWKHSGIYFDKWQIYIKDSESVIKLCAKMASEIKERYGQSKDIIEAVAGPADGGNILAFLLSHFLRSAWQEQVLFLPTQKEDKEKKQIFRKECRKLIAGKNVLVVDDILTTGGSIKKVIEEVKKAGGRVVAVATLCNRDRVTSEKLGYPLFSRWETKIKDWPEEECPLCAAGVPINKDVGRGEEFLAKKACK